ncbi:unnamed protein product [Amoebophrya sp. A25]|nr:unnamed protein product [Amoebophrya sp. A25]|eukprot:GSA25T00022306001.1
MLKLPPGSWSVLLLHLVGFVALHQVERSLFVPFLRSHVVCDPHEPQLVKHQDGHDQRANPNANVARVEDKTFSSPEAGVVGAGGVLKEDGGRKDKGSDGEVVVHPEKTDAAGNTLEIEDFDDDVDVDHGGRGKILLQLSSSTTGTSGRASGGSENTSGSSATETKGIDAIVSQLSENPRSEGEGKAKEEFTGSYYCNKKHVVIETAQQRAGTLDFVRILAHAVALPVFGAVGDLYGRKYITHVASLGLIVYFALLTSAAWLSVSLPGGGGSSLDQVFGSTTSTVAVAGSSSSTTSSTNITGANNVDVPPSFFLVNAIVFVACFLHGCLAYLTLAFAVHNILMDLSGSDITNQVILSTSFDITGNICITGSQVLVGKVLLLPGQMPDFPKLWFVCTCIACFVFLWQRYGLPETHPTLSKREDLHVHGVEQHNSSTTSTAGTSRRKGRSADHQHQQVKDFYHSTSGSAMGDFEGRGVPSPDGKALLPGAQSNIVGKKTILGLLFST